MFTRQRCTRLVRLGFESLEARQMLSATAFEHAGIGYFVDVTNRELDRYDINNQTWLTSTPLAGAASPPTVALADGDGIYVAYNTAVYRYNLDGTSPVHLVNAANPVLALHTDGNLLFVNNTTSLYARLISINKTTNTIIANFENYIDSVAGSSIAPQANRIFGRTIGVSPSDIAYVSYTDQGTFNGAGASPYHGDYPGASITWTFPDGGKVVDNSGTVYSTNSLTRLNSFGSSIDEIDFVGGTVPIVRKGTTLTAYTVGILPTGSMTLSSAPREILVNNQNILAVHNDGTMPSGYRVEVISLSALNAPTPGEPIDPNGLNFTPDNIVIAADGKALIFSKAHQSVFRWDPVRQEFAPTIPLIGAPDYMAYSAETNVIYLAYSGGLIRKIDLNTATPAEVPFATLPTSAIGLATAGQYLFAVDSSGPWVTHYTFAPNGSQISEKDWNYYSSEYIWSSVQKRMYHFRDDTSPNDLLAETIENGLIQGSVDSPLHESNGFSHPIRVSPDGSVVVLGSGKIHDATTLARKTETLSYSVKDIAWLGNRLFTVRDAGGVPQVQEWLGSTYAPGNVKQFTGVPHSLTAVANNRLMLVTLVGGVPKYTLLDENLNVVPRPTPVAAAGADVNVPIGVSITLDGSASYDPDNGPNPLTYQWSIVSGPGAGTFGAASSASTSFIAAAAGEYKLLLTVSDGVNSANDVVLVRARNNVAPVADASLSATVAVANRIAAPLDGSRSTDADGDALLYVWSVVSSPTGSAPAIANSQTRNASFSTNQPGAYTLKLTVTDGYLSDEDTVVVNVGENVAPNADASLSTLTGVASRTKPALNATRSSDPNGDPLTYQWAVIAGPVGAVTSILGAALPNATFAANIPGQYSVQLTVSDGLLTDADVIVITMGENKTPVADASASTMSVVVGTSLTLDGRKSTDPDGDAITYKWTVVASSHGVFPTISQSTSALASLNSSVAGSYGIALTVSDGLKTDVDYIIVTVRGNQPPVADLSLTTTTAVARTVVSLDGSRSHDPDGDSLTFAWQILTSTGGQIPAVTNASQDRASFVPPTEGAYLLQLAVSDGVASAAAFRLITVTPAPPALMPGDVDANGMVNGDDFLLIQRGLGKPNPSLSDGDADGDHDVDADDIHMFRAHFGEETASSAPRLLGDVDVDGFVDGDDILLWQRQLGGPVPPARSADVDRNGYVDRADLEHITTNFGREATTTAAATPAAVSAIAADAFFASGDFTSLFADPAITRRPFRPARRGR